LREKYSDEKRETNLAAEIIPVIINKYLIKDKNPGNAAKGLLG
jgi:hypothetical protein